MAGFKHLRCNFDLKISFKSEYKRVGEHRRTREEPVPVISCFICYQQAWRDDSTETTGIGSNFSTKISQEISSYDSADSSTTIVKGKFRICRILYYTNWSRMLSTDHSKPDSMGRVTLDELLLCWITEQLLITRPVTFLQDVTSPKTTVFPRGLPLLTVITH